MNKQIKLEEGTHQRSGFSKGPTTPKPNIIPKGQSTMNNNEFSKMSLKDLRKLQEDIQKHLENRDDLRVYKVTLFVGFHSNTSCGYLETVDDFVDYLFNEVSNYINNTLELSDGAYVDTIQEYLVNEVSNYINRTLELTDGVYVDTVEELEPSEFPGVFKT